MAESFARRSPLAHLGLAARAAAEARARTQAEAMDGTGGAAGVVLGERPFRGLVTLRGEVRAAAFVDAVRAGCGTAPPRDPNSSAGPADLGHGPRLLWLGPDEWLVVTAPERADEAAAALEDALRGQHAAVVDVSDSRAVIALAGANARDVLAKGCSLDLHPRAFKPGRCAQSLLAKTQVILHCVDDAAAPAPGFEIYLPRSFADYLWTWLMDAAAEYGVAVAADGDTPSAPVRREGVDEPPPEGQASPNAG